MSRGRFGGERKGRARPELVLAAKAQLPAGLAYCEIGIAGGRIVAVRKDLGRGAPRLSFGRGVLVPGAVDMHVHMREPGHTHKEDFLSGTASAAFGGVTFVADMPNNVPAVTTAAAYEKKIELVHGRAMVDFGLYAALDDRLESLVLGDRPIGYKAYLGRSTGGLLLSSKAALTRISKISSRAGRPLVIHAESERCLGARAAEARSLAQHSRARGDECEAEAVRELRASRVRGGHVAHVTSRRGLQALAGSGFTTEATPHHLLLDANAKYNPTALGKVNPPLRPGPDRASVWAAFKRGRIDVLASDHAPHTREEKSGPFESAPAGVPGVETMVPLMMSLVKRRSIGLSRLVEASSRRPARILGIRKGVIAPGYDADFAFYDLAAETRILGNELHSKCGWTPFERWRAVFPKAVYLRGELVVAEGELRAPRPMGLDWRG